MRLGQTVEQLEQLLILRPHRHLRGVTAQVAFKAGVDALQLRMLGQIGDVLADALEKQLHRVFHLTHLAPGAVGKGVARALADIEDDQRCHQ